MLRLARTVLLIASIVASACSRLYPFDEFRFDAAPLRDREVMDSGALEAGTRSDLPLPRDLTDTTFSENTHSDGFFAEGSAPDAGSSVDGGMCADPVAVSGLSDTRLCRTLGCPSSLCTTPDLHAVRGTDAQHIWAVGQYNAVYFFDGRAWTLEYTGAHNDELWGIAPFLSAGGTLGGVWAVGARGTLLLRTEALGWVPTVPVTESTLRDIAGTPSGFGMWAVGDHHTLLTASSGRPGAWSAVSFSPNVDLVAISVLGDFGLMLGRDGSVFRRTVSGAWTATTSVVGRPTDVHVFAPGSAWISGDRGLFRFVNTVITPALVAPRDLVSVVGDRTNATALIRGDSEYLELDNSEARVRALDVGPLEALGSAGESVLLGVGPAGARYFFRGAPTGI